MEWMDGYRKEGWVEDKGGGKVGWIEYEQGGDRAMCNDGMPSNEKELRCKVHGEY